MPTRRSPRKGSLQFWPRKRARKFLPSVNWNAIHDRNNSSKNLKGFICYKAGMVSVSIKDNTPDSMTKGKNIFIPATILECPQLKIFSVRFYKNNIVGKEELSENLDRELKRTVKIPKKAEKKAETDYDDIRVICYSLARKTGIKKTPDLCEMALSGSKEEKIKFVKDNLGKEISVLDVFERGQIVDIRGLTKGKGLSGPVKRFGIGLKQHKSEKGRRRPGSLGPWHPARVTFRAPQAGQLGMFSRVVYNLKILDMGKAEKKFIGIKNFGDVKTDYLVVHGSVQGPAKRVLLATAPLRATRKQSKKNYDVLKVLK